MMALYLIYNSICLNLNLMKNFNLLLICMLISMKSAFCQMDQIGINFNSPDKQKYLAIGTVTSAVSYKIFNDFYKITDPKSSRKKALIASTLTTLGFGIIKESLDFIQTGYRWNADDYGKDLCAALIGGCVVTVSFTIFK